MSHYHEDPSRFPLRGGCACGHIRYTLTAPPIIVHCCHCTACQRETGSAFVLNAIVETQLLTLDPPEEPTISAGPGVPAVPATLPSTLKSMGEPKWDTQDLGGWGEGEGSQEGEGEDPFACPPPPSSSPHSQKPITVHTPTESGLPQTIARCPRCYVALWSHYHCGAGRHGVFLRVGTLDTPSEVGPDVHIYTKSKRRFVSIDDGKPAFEGFYPKPQEVMWKGGWERYENLRAIVMAAYAAAKATP
ncbi:uncharacterized protein DNG_03668 [Cephalotrichum gorgonifer]|uniref:CENP-V/GFA domain-containing protein n=1 Tax=Cephalotrichum gorgonifer TaxID=2041049 RepID=A0AAE8MV59_9PEZI|nr:uncharacterized protein DNG_03668 [Cephalotrichum gorgonifer]